MSEARQLACAEVRERLVAFLDGEVAGEECWSIRRHLEVCPPCEQRAGIERGFKKVLRERLGPERAPASLAARIREALAREGSREARGAYGFSGWRLALAGVGYALAAFFLALWVTGRPAVPPGAGPAGEQAHAPEAARGGAQAVAALSEGRSGALALVSVQLQGVLVCAPCERLHVPMQRQIRCEAYGHLNGLRDAQGRLWNLVLLEPGGLEATRILQDGSLRGRTVSVEGDAIEKFSYLIPRRAELM